MAKHRGPLIFGSVTILGMAGFFALYRSSPGDLARPHAAVAGSPLITDCNKCHAKQGIAWGCLSCHSEIQSQLTSRRGYHNFLLKGKQPTCEHCHSEHNGAEFQLVNKVSWQDKDPKDFRHPQADYLLTGKHVRAACGDCHAAKGMAPFSLPKFPKLKRSKSYLGLTQECISCHRDVHAHGLAVHCGACHGQNAWKPTQPLFDHDKLFPLHGGHANLKCAQCHLIAQTRPSQTDLKKFPFDRVKGKTCVECHKNPHFTKWVEACEACHKANDPTWAAAFNRMTKTQHAMTGFRLTVPHQKTKCLDCHGPDVRSVPFKVKYPNPREPGYKRFEKNCEACHKDEHQGQFAKNHAHCVDCHSRTAFIPANYSPKDHKTYPLIGGHVAASCNACHIKDRGKATRQYVPTPKECGVCHKDAHVGQFRKDTAKTRCEDCHQTTVAWSKLVFNHNTQSRFKLDKAHENVACKDCHPWVTVQGVRFIQYKPLKMLCRDCHEFDH